MLRRHVCALALASSALLAPLTALETAAEPAVAQAIRFEVAPGTTLRKRLAFEHEIELKGVYGVQGDSRRVVHGTRGWVNGAVVAVIDDTVQRVGGGRPLALKRRIVNVGGKATATLSRGPGMSNDSMVQFGSPLILQEIDFLWIEEEGQYGRCYGHFEQYEEYLQGLMGDMDLLGVLPPGEVSPGDTWQLRDEALRPLISPGGNLLLWPKASGSMFARNVVFGIGGNVAQMVSGELYGEATLRYEGQREVDGVAMAVIAVELGQLLCETDCSVDYVKYMPQQEQDENSQFLEAGLTFELRAGRGELLWNLAEGRYHSLLIEGEQYLQARVAKRMGATMEVPEGRDLVEEFEMGGRLVISLTLLEEGVAVPGEEYFSEEPGPPAGGGGR